MDNLTHGLVGALIGQAGLKRKTGLAMPALVIGANLPDVDAACFLWLDGVQHVGFRRGITHGPIAWGVLPLILAGLLWGWDRWQAKRGKRPEGRLPVHFGWLYALAFIACLTHPALDWLNVYGIRLLEPFSTRWFYGDVLFIIDVWLWLGLGFATWLSLRRERRGGEWRRPARIAIAGALVYVGTNWLITERAETDLTQGLPAGAIAIASPQPLLFYKRETIVGDGSGLWIIDGKVRGGDLRTCNLVPAAERDPDLRAFLFWSRAPFAEEIDGGWTIRDARYATADRFSVPLKDGCWIAD